MYFNLCFCTRGSSVRNVKKKPGEHFCLWTDTTVLKSSDCTENITAQRRQQQQNSCPAGAVVDALASRLSGPG